MTGDNRSRTENGFLFLGGRQLRDWLKQVNRPETAVKLDALRQSVARGRPFGGPAWTKRVAHRLGLQNTLRDRGRPRKKPQKNTGE